MYIVMILWCFTATYMVKTKHLNQHDQTPHRMKQLSDSIWPAYSKWEFGMSITSCTPSIHNQANAQTQWGTAAIWRPSRTRHTPDGLRILPLLLSKPQPSGCLLVACACLGTCAPGNAGCQARPWPREHIDANQSEMRFWNHHPQHSESTLMHCVQSSYLDQT